VDPVHAYRELNEQVFRLYAAGRQDEALRLLDAVDDALAPWQAELAYLRACIHGSLGQPDRAVAALEAAAAEGAWWDPAVLAGDDDLADTRELPAFGPLLEVVAERWRAAHAERDRDGDRLAMPDGPVRGVLIALHGAEEDADDAMLTWRSATESGHAVLAVRSSQRTSPNYRTWPDGERAAAEIADAYAGLPVEVRSLPVIAAGFSAGGRVALRWALTGEPFAAAGVIAVAPAIAVDALPTPLPAALDPARLLVGADDDLAGDVAAVADRLASAGFVLDVFSGLGHAFPVDFRSRLAALLRSI
jgi:dienelactone hydrolase